MIIDTKGFEIGDEVWYIWFGNRGYYPKSEPIHGFEITKTNIRIITKYMRNIFNISDTLYYTQQECQLECDKLNGVSHD